MFNSYNLEDDEENADPDTPESSVDLLRMRLGTRLKPETANHEDDGNLHLSSLNYLIPAISFYHLFHL